VATPVRSLVSTIRSWNDGAEPKDGASIVRTPPMSWGDQEEEEGGNAVQPSSASNSARKAGTQTEVSPENYEVFASTLTCRRLPVIAFTDDLGEQHVWEDGCVHGGQVHRPDGPPDLCAPDPVVMSPGYLGFSIEPYMKRYLHYRDVGIVFARPMGGKFMAPSIDTVLVSYGLDSLFNRAPAMEVRRVIDVGSGCGFLGKFAAVHAPGSGALSVTLVDIDPAALAYCQTDGFNAPASGLRKRHVSWEFRVQDAIKLLDKDSKYDFIVSNPPYVPTRAEAEGASTACHSESFWEGVHLVVHLVELILEGRCAPGAHLAIMVTSLTLKAPKVRELLRAAPKRGVHVQVLVEREIAWKAWYAGPEQTDYLMASGEERRARQSIGDCSFFVGATKSGRLGDKDRACPSYSWHVAYVLDIHRPA